MSNITKLDKIYNKLTNAYHASGFKNPELSEAIDLVDELINAETAKMDLYKGASEDADDYFDGFGITAWRLLLILIERRYNEQ